MIKKLLNDRKRLFLILGCFVVVVVLLLIIILISNSVNDGKRFEKEYEKLNDKFTSSNKKYPKVDISKNNKMKYVSYDEFFDVLDNNGSAVVYIGYAKCLYCRTAVQVLTDTAKDMDIDEILYLDVEVKGSDGYGKLVETFKDKFFVDGISKDKFYVPSVLFVVDGNVVSYNKGTLFSQESAYDQLDQSQIDGLSGIYKNGINDVIKGIKNID